MRHCVWLWTVVLQSETWRLINVTYVYTVYTSIWGVNFLLHKQKVTYNGVSFLRTFFHKEQVRNVNLSLFYTCTSIHACVVVGLHISFKNELWRYIRSRVTTGNRSCSLVRMSEGKSATKLYFSCLLKKPRIFLILINSISMLVHNFWNYK